MRQTGNNLSRTKALTASEDGLRPTDNLATRLAAAKLDSGNSAVSLNPDDLSYQYWSSCCLHYDDHIHDGFYDVFGTFAEAVTSLEEFPSMTALQRVRPKVGAHRQVILYDSRNDKELRDLIEEAREVLELPAEGSSEGRPLSYHRQLALLVAGRLGGPQASLNQAISSANKHSADLQSELGSVIIPAGQLSIGSTRHRAIMFKYLADLFGLEVRVMKGRFYADTDDGARCVIKVKDEEFELDLTVRPGMVAPLETKLALRASSREVAGSDIFSRASSMGGSTGGASRTPSDAAKSDAAIVAAVDNISKETSSYFASLPTSAADNASTRSIIGGPAQGATLGLEEAMQLAAAAAMSAQPRFPVEPSPFASVPEPEQHISNFGHYSLSLPSWHSQNHLPMPKLPEDQPIGADPSLLPFSSTNTRPSRSFIRMSDSYQQNYNKPDVLELGPPALISDASGQQFLVQPVRTSANPRNDCQSYGSDGQTLGDATLQSQFSGVDYNNVQRSTSDAELNEYLIGYAAQHDNSGNDSSYTNAQPSSSLSSKPSINTPNDSILQWAALQASTSSGLGSSSVPMPSSGLSTAGIQLSVGGPGANLNLPPVMEHRLSYSESLDVTRLYLDGLRNSSLPPAYAATRMSVPIEFDRQALLSRVSNNGHFYTSEAGVNSPPIADLSDFPGKSRSSGDGVAFPAPELPTTSENPFIQSDGKGQSDGKTGSGGSSMGGASLFTPFGTIPGPLTASSPGSSTVSQDGAKLGLISRNHSIAAETNVSVTAVGTIAATGTTSASLTHASSEAHQNSSLVHMASPTRSSHQKQKSTMLSMSTMSTLRSTDGLSIGSYDEDEGWEIPEDELQLGSRIGIGSFGEVFRGQWRQTDVAIKLFLDQDLGARMIESFSKEVSIMKKLRHPNIVQFMGACTKPPRLCIVTQYVPRGSLFKLLHRQNKGCNPTVLDERRRLQMALDVCRGMNYLHTCRPPIIHRDLKSPNLLVEKDMSVKVCDFGLSRVRHATVLSAKSQAGTPEWTAPEVLQGKPCNEASDVYSFGVILWELLTGEEPWAEKSAMQVVGAVGFAHERLPIPSGTSPALGDLMKRCFGVPEERPTFSEIIPILKKQISLLTRVSSLTSPISRLQSAAT